VDNILGDNRESAWFLAVSRKEYGEKPTMKDVLRGVRPVESAAFAFADIVVREGVDCADAIAKFRKAFEELKEKRGPRPIEKPIEKGIPQYFRKV